MTYRPLYEISSPRRALYTIENQRTNGFAVCLAGGYWVSHDTPRMWRLMHHTTPLNDFIAVGTPAQIVNAWQQAIAAPVPSDEQLDTAAYWAEERTMKDRY